jgi:hypothetical protein
MTLTGYLKVYSHLMVTISTTRVMQRIMTLKKTTVFTQIQADEAFSLNSVIKYERLSLRTKMDCAEQEWTTLNQTRACTADLS